MGEHTVKLDERGEQLLLAASAKKDMSPEAMLRHWVRLGQTVDLFMALGGNLRIEDPATGEITDPFASGPKKAPKKEKIIPAIFDVKEHLDCACWETGRYQRVEGCPYHPYAL